MSDVDLSVPLNVVLQLTGMKWTDLVSQSIITQIK
jgi:hypothetical protein